ncbi:hypothetical protein M2337_002384 [Sphingobium sp. B2D3A]|uniref:hypothetical protein n=1 Tax=unclassified Sphingobium TaxID=2611147 RepID=UPI002224C109|nr:MULTISPECIES: hypothetical protein [unclassified Sphingobium]MCW2338151.1 hypothetical protein [Sphingobium sp. B2D3A]MCW2384610.1 hypothetical protein [Sphingobium sp. B2D3D]
MATQIMTDPTEVCEQTLRDKKAYNIEHSIWPSENIVIDRLLERRTELIHAYAEIHEKLHQHSWGIYSLLGVVLNVTVLWNPERVADARDARNRLEEINQAIAAMAQDLTGLIEERSELGNTSGFASDTHYHIVDVIDAASSENGFYRFHLKDELKPLATRYDLKYWPSLAEIVQVIGQDADFAATRATDPLTRAATTGSRGSKADFFKALFVSLDENNVRNHGHLPRGFKLSDETLASLANCALDLGPDDLLDGAYVKRLRQREREARKTGE